MCVSVCVRERERALFIANQFKIPPTMEVSMQGKLLKRHHAQFKRKYLYSIYKKGDCPEEVFVK